MERIITENEKEKYYFKGDFEIINNTIISYKGKDSDVTIPDGITKIGDEAFAYCLSICLPLFRPVARMLLHSIVCLPRLI